MSGEVLHSGLCLNPKCAPMLGFQDPIVEVDRGRNVGEQGRSKQGGMSQMGVHLYPEGSGSHLASHANRAQSGEPCFLAQLTSWVMSSGYLSQHTLP